MLSINIEDGFADYDPFSTELTHETLFTLGPVAQKAKQFVRGKSKADLQKIIDKCSPSLNLARSKAMPHIFKLLQGTTDEGFFHSDCTCLYLCRDEFETDLKIDGKIIWSEVFATIALANIGLLYSQLSQPELTIDKISEELIRQRSAEEKVDTLDKFDTDFDAISVSRGILFEHMEFRRHALFYAMEAVTYATIEQLEEKRKEYQSNRNAASQKAQQEKYSEAKKWICHEYQAIYDNLKQIGEPISNDDAAHKLEKVLSNDPNIITGKRPKARTIAKWIGEFKGNKAKNLPGIPPFIP